MRRLTALLVCGITLAGSTLALAAAAPAAPAGAAPAAPAAPAAGLPSRSAGPGPGRRSGPPPTQVDRPAPGSGRPLWLICALCAGAIGIALLPPGRRVRTHARGELDPWARALRRGPGVGNRRRPVARR